MKEDKEENMENLRGTGKWILNDVVKPSFNNNVKEVVKVDKHIVKKSINKQVDVLIDEYTKMYNDSPNKEIGDLLIYLKSANHIIKNNLNNVKTNKTV